MARPGPPPRQWLTAQEALTAALSHVAGRDVLRVPAVLDIDPQSLARLLSLLQTIRKRVLSGREVTLDMRSTRRISPVATLLLAAEVDRCNALRRRSVWGTEPHGADARAVLSAFGFYEAIGSIHLTNLDQWSGVVRIQPGTGSPADIPRKLALISDLAAETWDDPIFCDRVHSALNEAMTNVIMHAYDEELLKVVGAPCIPGRWWVAGFSPPDADHAWFMALDHGVGIPVSAPAKNQGVRAYLATTKKNSDEEVLYSVVADEGRSRTGLPQHGKGVPAMIGLIREQAEEGTVWILSGGGGFLLRKHAGTATLPGRIYEMPFTLPAPLSGTLVLWRVGRPISKAAHSADPRP